MPAISVRPGRPAKSRQRPVPAAAVAAAIWTTRFRSKLPFPSPLWGGTRAQRARVGVERSAVAVRKTQRTERIWAIRDRSVVPVNRVRARAMRLEPTDAERKLWWHLRHRLQPFDSHFRRQVHLGRYIADFVCHRLKLIVEVD